MWEALISSLFSVLKSHFDEIIMRITMWCLSFILCWLYIPIGVQLELQAYPLPGLPAYTLIYLFYLTAATTFWQGFIILLEVIAVLWEKSVNYKTIQPKTKRVKVN